MSPQLGQGANLALIDAEKLVDCLQREALGEASGGGVEAALAAYTRERWWRLQFYQAQSRLLTPVFASHSELIRSLERAPPPRPPILWISPPLLGPPLLPMRPSRSAAQRRRGALLRRSGRPATRCSTLAATPRSSAPSCTRCSAGPRPPTSAGPGAQSRRKSSSGSWRICRRSGRRCAAGRRRRVRTGRPRSWMDGQNNAGEGAS